MNLSRRKLIQLSAYSCLSLILNQKVFSQSKRQSMNVKPIKIAILGLGNYAEHWIAPAIAQSNYAQLTGIITGSPHKIPAWQKKYSIPDSNVYTYSNLEEIANNPSIDCVYIVTPTGTHTEFTVRSFEAGKHVICEKPMAPSVTDCDRMIQAAESANKTLQIGYRLYWDPYNVRLMDAMENKEFGSLLGMQGGFSYDHGRWAKEGDWRMNPAMNPGGALFDIGVYVVQSAFYSTQMHPVSLTARHTTERKSIFKEIPEHWNWELTWPNRWVSQHSASYGKHENFLRLQTEKGNLSLEPAYSYEGLSGVTPDGKMEFQPIFQQRRQIDGQCLAILQREPNLTSGAMGRRDIQLLSAIMEAGESGNPVSLNSFY